MTDLAREKRVIVLPPTRMDGQAIGSLFSSSRIEYEIVSTVAEICGALQHGAGALVISEEAVLRDSESLLSCVAAQPMWSDIPILVLSRSGRESMALAEILTHLGNVSVVERPVRMSTLITLVRSGLRARARQYQVREYLSRQAGAEAEREALLDSERAARAHAERSGRMKDEFLATLSHELRTPLNAILGWTHVMRKKAGLKEDFSNALDVIERNARSQAQIIEDLLDMSRIISGKVRLDIQRADLAAIVASTVETVKPAAQAKGIRLQMMLDPSAGNVRGDPNRLQQILWNLLTNAVKFTPKGGRASISLARVNSHLEIEVEDTGEGIEPEFLPHVFDRFRQSDASSARRHGGLGLGLSIVKQLVELHGGTISAQSDGLGNGSTFRVMLPLAATHFHEEQTDPPRVHPRRSNVRPGAEQAKAVDLRGIKILVVDDEPDARALVERLLNDCHATVRTAAGADEAIDALMKETPDVLVSDIGMPGQDGYTLIRRVRALEGVASAVPAIALTAYARIEDRVKAIQTGYQLHLAKPVEPVELLAMVKSLAPDPQPR